MLERFKWRLLVRIRGGWSRLFVFVPLAPQSLLACAAKLVLQVQPSQCTASEQARVQGQQTESAAPTARYLAPSRAHALANGRHGRHHPRFQSPTDSQALAERLLLEFPLEPLGPEPLGKPPPALLVALPRAVPALDDPLLRPLPLERLPRAAAGPNSALVAHGRAHDKDAVAVAVAALVGREVVEPDAAVREREGPAPRSQRAEGRAELAGGAGGARGAAR